jgi:hypothetical protein
MKARKWWVLAVAAGCCIGVCAAVAENGSEEQEMPEYSTTVQLVVKGEGEIESEVYGHISSGLRSL